MIRTAPFLVATMLLISPTVGAATPDYPDSDGDVAAGPVGILGVSADSGSSTFTFDLFIDNFEFGSSRVHYEWDFAVGLTTYQWSCLASKTYEGPDITCEMWRQEPTPEYDENELVDNIRDPRGPRLEFPEDKSSGPVEAVHHLDLDEGTVGFTASYGALKVSKGDAIKLVEGRAYFLVPDPTWAGSPADAMAVGEDVVLK